MEVKVTIVNAFTQNGTGGNPAAIVTDAGRFTSAQKQQIAKQVGLSETAFISDSDAADFKFEFFTPTRQIAHCGHATIAAFAHLKQQGKITGDRSSKETIDGNRQIIFIGEKPFMEQLAPKFTAPDPEDVRLIEKSLGLSKTDLAHPISIVNTGNSFLIVPLKKAQTLQNLEPDFETIHQLSEQYNLIGYYAFATDTDYDATARMFAPLYGIEEESATGMAAGPLACYLYEFVQPGHRYVIEQGRFMKAPSASLIEVELELNQGQIGSLMAGGNATFASEQWIRID
ncbi:PhzF family phenazine biosynthesis protein [Flavobacterium sp.]|uniref:PhzF family phenazine biosynthesis protein n=1 Tax=Flavobacterium sp. TaxID=239 RepID=UPI0039E264CB